MTSWLDHRVCPIVCRVMKKIRVEPTSFVLSEGVSGKRERSPVVGRNTLKNFYAVEMYVRTYVPTSTWNEMYLEL